MDFNLVLEARTLDVALRNIKLPTVDIGHDRCRGCVVVLTLRSQPNQG